MTRAMKDSGIDWIGDIPENWTTSKVKYCFTRKNSKAKQEDPIILSLARSGVKVRDISTNEGQLPESYYDYNPVQIGDLLLNPMDLYSGANCSYSNVEGVISPAYINLRNKETVSNSKFYDYYFKVQYWMMVLFSFGKGVSFDNRWTLGQETLMNFPLVYPPLSEQKKIADFLDEKCKHIDLVLEKTRASIDEYKQLKQSVITQAVTKGIRPNRPMKDSGIEWIGEIPEDWETIKLKYACNNRNENYSNEYGALEYFALENIESKSAKFIYTENSYDITQSQICKENDVVFGKLRPYLAKVYQVPKLCCCSGEFAIFYNFDGIADYYKYLMLSHWFINIVDASTYGTKMPRANIQFIKNMDITIPSQDEQQEIVSYLDSKCSEIDKLIAKKEQLIAELETYKKSLIYEYVTGKKEVC